jgi:hypothetical protein
MIHQVSPEDFLYHELPPQTQSYKPVSNALINQMIYEEAKHRQYQITGKGYRANPSRTEFIAMFTLDNPKNGLSRMIGYRNSTNKKWAVGFVAGALVMICTNGMISGDIITIRRHTGSIRDDLRLIVKQAFDEITPRFNSLLQETAFLHEKLIQKPVALEIVSELFFSKEILTVTQMSKLKEKFFVDQNFSIPKDPETFFPAWNLYNQLTEAMKHGAPGNFFNQHIELHDYFIEKLEMV